MKALIVNADDFGLSPEVNAGVIRAHREGVLTSASLMVTASACEAAVAAARDLPKLDVGLHLVLCQGSSTMPHTELGGIVDANGRFGDNPTIAGLKYFFDRKLRDKLRAECRAQIERHLKLTGSLNHIDGHLNIHVHPVVADILIDLAAEYHVPCLRLPREPVFTTLALARDHLRRKLVGAVIFRSLSARARRKMAERGIRSTDWLFGLHQSGNFSESYLLGLIARLPEGTTELYFHPAADVGGLPPSPHAQIEVELLTSPGLRAALDAHGVRLTTFAEMAQAPQPGKR
ncbi:MAG: hopanoid biosynthesis-associated protein HpnK [Candidatus Binataceae bacterium]